MFNYYRVIAIETLWNFNPLCYSTTSIDSTKDKREVVGSYFKKKGELLQKSQIRELSIPNILEVYWKTNDWNNWKACRHFSHNFYSVAYDTTTTTSVDVYRVILSLLNYYFLMEYQKKFVNVMYVDSVKLS